MQRQPSERQPRRPHFCRNACAVNGLNARRITFTAAVVGFVITSKQWYSPVTFSRWLFSALAGLYRRRWFCRSASLMASYPPTNGRCTGTRAWPSLSPCSRPTGAGFSGNWHWGFSSLISLSVSYIGMDYMETFCASGTKR